jgi:AcrR family transcriptional regulator
MLKQMDKKEKSKEEAILEAAEQEFLDKGFEGAKTTTISSIAGATHAMLHYYFRTKENLFNKVFDEKIKLMSQVLFNLVDDPDIPLHEKIKVAIETHFDFLRDNPNLPRFIINELISKPQRLNKSEKVIKGQMKTVYDKVKQAIDREVEKGTITPIEPFTLLIDIISLNLFTFIFMPVLKIFAIEKFGDENNFLESRRRENVEIIMRRLRKD